jgi:glucose-1-phosphate thymidylyltransferase
MDDAPVTRPDPSDIVGLVPAAGRARRLPGLAGSKEAQPVDANRVISQDLLDALARAGVGTAFVVVRAGKWDLPELYGPGPPRVALRLAWLITRGTGSVPASLDLAYPFVRDRVVVTGFPDCRFHPADAIDQILRQHRESGRIVLGLFPSDRPDKTDMVELGADGRVASLCVKPGDVGLRYTWLFAAWGPTFTEFLHEFLQGGEASQRQDELHTSEVFQAALDRGMAVDAVRFDDGEFLDIGTPEDLRRLRTESD